MCIEMKSLCLSFALYREVLCDVDTRGFIATLIYTLLNAQNYMTPSLSLSLPLRSEMLFAHERRQRKPSIPNHPLQKA